MFSDMNAYEKNVVIFCDFVKSGRCKVTLKNMNLEKCDNEMLQKTERKKGK